jgi:hypothetical protein
VVRGEGRLPGPDLPARGRRGRLRAGRPRSLAGVQPAARSHAGQRHRPDLRVRRRSERDALPPEEFARERLGWWDEPGAADAFGTGRWEACAGDPPPADVQLTGLAVAVSYDLTQAAVVAAGKDDDDVIHAAPLRHGPGTGWVVDAVRELSLEYPDLQGVVVDQGGPAADLIPKLEGVAGLPVIKADTADVCDACAGIWKRVQERAFRHAAYPELNDAAAAAVRRPVGDRWAWGRKQSEDDISALEGATLAAWLVDDEGGVQFFW